MAHTATITRRGAGACNALAQAGYRVAETDFGRTAKAVVFFVGSDAASGGKAS
jgi:hypothetical protein